MYKLSRKKKMRKIRRDKNVYIPSAYPHVELLYNAKWKVMISNIIALLHVYLFFFQLFFFIININFTIMLKTCIDEIQIGRNIGIVITCYSCLYHYYTISVT